MSSKSVPVDGLLQNGILYQMTALEIIEKARELPEDEQMEIVKTISKDLSNDSESLLSEDEECLVENVLLERSPGPFEQPTKSEFDARVGAEIARLGKQQNG